jgi:hypothetical protein
MSTNHRTRIKSVADYAKNLTDIGACCYPHADAPEEEYYNTCLEKGGHWQPFDNNVTEITCPDLGATGCCCSCSYVDDFNGSTGLFNAYAPGIGICSNIDDGQYNYPCYQGGLKNNVSFCECNAKGGVWAQGVDCDVYTETDGTNPEYVIIGAHSLCTKGGNIDDVRWPGACCTGITCSNACSTKECMEASEDLGVFSDITFLLNNYCSEPDGTAYPGHGEDVIIDCDSIVNSGFVGDNRNFEKDNRTGIWTTKTNFNDILNSDHSKGSQSKVYSSCVYISKGTSGYEMKCSAESKSSCKDLDGMWGGFDKGNHSLQCEDNTIEDIKDYVTNKKKISQSVVNTWNVGDRVLNVGRFVGEFYSKDDTRGIGSECFGNEKTGESYNYYSEGDNNTISAGKSFAIIIADSDYNHKYTSSEGWEWDKNTAINNVQKSSTWDFVHNNSYNNHLSLMKNINRLYANPWITWSLPTKDQLAFIVLQLNSLDFISNTTIENKAPNIPYVPMVSSESVFYWSSTFLTNINYANKTQLSYCQSIGDNSLVVLSPINKKHKVRLITAIEIV